MIQIPSIIYLLSRVFQERHVWLWRGVYPRSTLGLVVSRHTYLSQIFQISSDLPPEYLIMSLRGVTACSDAAV